MYPIDAFRGATWIERSSGLTRFDIIALAQLDESAILAVNRGDEVFRSRDGGMSWSRLEDRFSPPSDLKHLVRDAKGGIIAAHALRSSR